MDPFVAAHHADEAVLWLGMDPRLLLGILTGLGAAATIGGLVDAWFGARRQYLDSKARVDKLEALMEAELAEAAVPPGGDSHLLLPVLHEDDKWDAIYKDAKLIRPTYDNAAFLAAYESRRLLGLVLDSTGRDFFIAAAGLLVSTGASIGSLFIPS